MMKLRKKINLKIEYDWLTFLKKNYKFEQNYKNIVNSLAKPF